jgi:hypothetical protein
MWAASPVRPRIGSGMKKHWDALVGHWAASDLPFIVRRSGLRGNPIRHASGRTIILADNSPSQWAFTKAYAGAEFSLDDIRGILAARRMPFAMVLKGEEKQKSAFKCTLTASTRSTLTPRVTRTSGRCTAPKSYQGFAVDCGLYRIADDQTVSGVAGVPPHSFSVRSPRASLVLIRARSGRGDPLSIPGCRDVDVGMLLGNGGGRPGR